MAGNAPILSSGYTVTLLDSDASLDAATKLTNAHGSTLQGKHGVGLLYNWS